MQITKNQLPKNQLELTIELSIDEMKPYLEEAAAEISKGKKIAGFRPGHAPYDIVKKEVGEMQIYQTAGNNAISATYYNAIEKQGLQTVEQPKVDIIKLAPDNPFIYKATVALLPKITVCDYSKIKVKALDEIKIEEQDIDKVLNDLQKMRAKETLENKSAEIGDKVELDFDTFVDNVPIDGGQAKKHALVVGQGNMIPGFEDNLVGLKKDETKEFKLTFPKKYHSEKLQNKEATFKVKILAVYKIELPKLDDEFAKTLGLKTIEDLKKNIETNLKQEKEAKAKQAQELELLEKLIDKSEFGELPDILINQETHKMLHELEDNLTKQGMKMEDYLKHLKKTEAEMRLDFTPDAIKRVKTGLLIREIAQKENIKAEEKEIDEEIERTLASYKLNPAYAQQLDDLEKSLKTDNARHYFKNVIVNRKTVEKLKALIIKQ